MRLTRLYLRNYRVFEDALELELPPGLIGIFGVNGAGKSALLESILWTLWGRARTGKDEVRTSGVGGECVTEVEFEHEGHLYLARRTLSGVNSTVRAEVHCDQLIVSEGVRDTSRYLHQVLGMDDTAFRASVFAEQKQLAAFSDQTPAERRKLVLQLLGITPLEAARDTARKDARQARDQHERLRAMLPDLDQLRVDAEDADARAGAAEAVAAGDEAAAAVARDRAARAEKAWRDLDVTRQEYDNLVVEGKAARAELDGATVDVTRLTGELGELEGAALHLRQLEPVAAGLAEAEARQRLVEAAVAAERAAEAVVVPPEPLAVDEAAWEAATGAAEKARGGLAVLGGQVEAVGQELARARAQAERSAGLSGEADCPLCGQSLGAAFEEVQAHRAQEVADAQARLADLEATHRHRRATAKAAAEALAHETRTRQQRQQARTAWEQAATRVADAEAHRTQAWALLEESFPGLVAPERRLGQDGAAIVQLEVAVAREATREAERLRGRLERKPAVVRQLDEARARVDDVAGRVAALRDKVKALGFDPQALAAAVVARDEAVDSAERAARSAQTARLTAERERARAEGAATRLADARAQHDKLVGLASDALHLGRVADLLNAFRTAVVATVGPRLAVQAAELFGELTDHEYDRLEVDPETYQLQIRDAGRVFGLGRFSGSEVDLANLALRVAISEHVRFQSGGSVGLLVLDEVFGPLDEDRKARMLLALERLKGRFRQILVVTHDSDIKEQLPNAVEVHKLPGRRATARLLNP
jgi:DNA repair exonuclease SbcCD ATPase subunit